MKKYQLKFIAYCGMSYPINNGSHAEMRQSAKDYLAKHRNKKSDYYTDVTYLGGYEWEVTEPEGCIMVPDWCGYLVIKEVNRK